MLRIENLLFLVMLVPVFEPAELTGWDAGGVVDSFIMILPLYMMHYFLRAIGRRNKPVCFIHVIITLLYALYAGGLMQAVSVVPGWHTPILSPDFINNPLHLGTTLLYLLLQAAFIIYGFVTIHNWRKSSS